MLADGTRLLLNTATAIDIRFDARERRVVVPAAGAARRAVVVLPTPDSACSAASRRWYSSTSGRSSFRRCEISLRFSSRKSGIQQTFPINRFLT